MMKPLWLQPISLHALTWRFPGHRNPRQKQKTPHLATPYPFETRPLISIVERETDE